MHSIGLFLLPSAATKSSEKVFRTKWQKLSSPALCFDLSLNNPLIGQNSPLSSQTKHKVEW
jgi:hypothetical protein